MPEPPKPTDWLNKIPAGLTAAFALIGTIAAFIIDFRERWQLFTTITIALVLGYIFAVSLFVFVARRKTRSKKSPWTYTYGRFRPLGLVGVVFACLSVIGLMAAPATRQFAIDSLLGTPTLLPTSTPVPTSPPFPTPTLVPTPTSPQLENPDVVITRFDGSEASFVLDVAGQLEGNLGAYLRENGLPDVSLQVRDDQTVESEVDAQNVANLTKSKVLIWGKYDDTYIQVRVFLSGGDQAGTELPGTDQIALESSDPTSDLAFKVQGVLTENLSFLAPFVLGHLHYHSNNYEAGHQAFDFAMDHIPTNAIVENEAIIHFFRARKLDRERLRAGTAGLIDEVICEYKEAILRDPDFDVAYNNLGLVLSTFYPTKFPVPESIPSDHIPPESLVCLQQLQQAKLLDAKLQDPQMYFRRALDVNPDLTLAKFNFYAFAAMQKQEPETLKNIISELEKIQEADPSLVGASVILASTKERQGDIAGAIETYRLGIEQMERLGLEKAGPNVELMLFNLGQLFAQQENWSAAQPLYEKLLELNPRHFAGRVALGNLYYRQGKFSETAPHFDAIVTIPIESDPIIYQYHKDALVLRSGVQFREGDLPGAIQSVNQAVQAFSGDPYPHLLLGLLHQVQDKNDLARESFSNAIEQDIDFEQTAWSTFEDNCLDEASKQSFADWILNQLPSSDCLGRDLSDPKERILTFYDLFSDALFQYQEAASFIFTHAQCPYLYTADPLTGEWEFDTTILYRIVEHETAQMRPLTQFDGRIWIREEEPEITYLNQLYVLAEMVDGSFRILQPDVEALKQADGDYVVLDQGEVILLSLEPFPVKGEVRQWWVMAVGYYSPLR